MRLPIISANKSSSAAGEEMGDTEDESTNITRKKDALPGYEKVYAFPKLMNKCQSQPGHKKIVCPPGSDVKMHTLPSTEMPIEPGIGFTLKAEPEDGVVIPSLTDADITMALQSGAETEAETEIDISLLAEADTTHNEESNIDMLLRSAELAAEKETIFVDLTEESSDILNNNVQSVDDDQRKQDDMVTSGRKKEQSQNSVTYSTPPININEMPTEKTDVIYNLSEKINPFALGNFNGSDDNLLTKIGIKSSMPLPPAMDVPLQSNTGNEIPLYRENKTRDCLLTQTKLNFPYSSETDMETNIEDVIDIPADAENYIRQQLEASRNISVPIINSSQTENNILMPPLVGNNVTLLAPTMNYISSSQAINESIPTTDLGNSNLLFKRTNDINLSSGTDTQNGSLLSSRADYNIHWPSHIKQYMTLPSDPTRKILVILKPELENNVPSTDLTTPGTIRNILYKPITTPGATNNNNIPLPHKGQPKNANLLTSSDVKTDISWLTHNSNNTHVPLEIGSKILIPLDTKERRNVTSKDKSVPGTVSNFLMDSITPETTITSIPHGTLVENSIMLSPGANIPTPSSRQIYQYLPSQLNTGIAMSSSETLKENDITKFISDSNTIPNLLFLPIMPEKKRNDPLPQPKKVIPLSSESHILKVCNRRVYTHVSTEMESETPVPAEKENEDRTKDLLNPDTIRELLREPITPETKNNTPIPHETLKENSLLLPSESNIPGLPNRQKYKYLVPVMQTGIAMSSEPINENDIPAQSVSDSDTIRNLMVEPIITKTKCNISLPQPGNINTLSKKYVHISSKIENNIPVQQEKEKQLDALSEFLVLPTISETKSNTSVPHETLKENSILLSSETNIPLLSDRQLFEHLPLENQTDNITMSSESVKENIVPTKGISDPNKILKQLLNSNITQTNCHLYKQLSSDIESTIAIPTEKINEDRTKDLSNKDTIRENLVTTSLPHETREENSILFSSEANIPCLSNNNKYKHLPSEVETKILVASEKADNGKDFPNFDSIQDRSPVPISSESKSPFIKENELVQPTEKITLPLKRKKTDHLPSESSKTDDDAPWLLNKRKYEPLPSEKDKQIKTEYEKGGKDISDFFTIRNLLLKKSVNDYDNNFAKRKASWREKLDNILHSTQFCGICLKTDDNMNSVNDEFNIVIEDDGERTISKRLGSIIESVLKEPDNSMANTEICTNCTNKLIQSYIFIENAKDTSKMLHFYMNNLYGKVCSTRNKVLSRNTSKVEETYITLDLYNDIKKEKEEEKDEPKETDEIKEETFKCETCNTILLSNEEILQHETKHKTALKCKMCDRNFDNDEDLLTHYKSHMKSQCSICLVLIEDGEVLEHMKTHHKDSIYLCKICDVCLFSWEALESHKSTSHNRNHTKCFTCLKRFRQVKSKRHKCKYGCTECTTVPCTHNKYLQGFRKEIENGGLRAKCIECDFVSGCKETLISHVNVAHLKYPCRRCDSRFHLEEELDTHMSEKHSLEMKTENFLCKNCNVVSPNLGSWYRHRRNCARKKNLRCFNCCITFKTFKDHAEHRKTKHQMDEMKPCDECSKGFPNAWKKRRHLIQCHSFDARYAARCHF